MQAEALQVSEINQFTVQNSLHPKRNVAFGTPSMPSSSQVVKLVHEATSSTAMSMLLGASLGARLGVRARVQVIRWTGIFLHSGLSFSIGFY